MNNFMFFFFVIFHTRLVQYVGVPASMPRVLIFFGKRKRSWVWGNKLAKLPIDGVDACRFPSNAFFRPSLLCS